MNVTLLDYTGAGHADPARYAANLLVFTKQTRLTMEPGLLEEIASWPQERIEEELRYMANTIPSSWEFVTYTFMINDVTRGFTHQFVRTRTGSYAQQTMRVLDVRGWGYGVGPTVEVSAKRSDIYDSCMRKIAKSYQQLIEAGAKIEDARGVLPTNIHTNIVAKFDLRTLADTMRKRASTRTQGEYRDVMDGMKDAVLKVHPWAALFFDRTFERAAADLERSLLDSDMDAEKRTHLIKLIDQMRATV
jgi:thymidylate synthase (FAD)